MFVYKIRIHALLKEKLTIKKLTGQLIDFGRNVYAICVVSINNYFFEHTFKRVNQLSQVAIVELFN